MRKRVAFDSAAIATATYDFVRRTLDVEFREGDTYRYLAVPQFLFEALLEADSAGGFWNSVKDNYRYEKLG
jgi:hypothetical protein